MATLRECMKNFLLHCIYEKNLSAKSIKAYKIDLTQFEAFLEKRNETVTVDLIDKEKLREYVKTISQGSKPKTVKRKIATLKAFFNYLEFEDVLVSSPFRKLKIKIKEGKRLPKTIALPKIISLFNFLYRTKTGICNRQNAHKVIIRDIAVIELLFSTGLRVAELCNLKEENIDFLKGSLRIIGKGNKERIVPICNSETISAVDTYRKLFQCEILKAGYFFVNRVKSRLSEQSVRFMIKKYSKALNLKENITPHMFRHSIATLLLEGGVDIRYIQNFLGHSLITTTQIYAQVNTEAQRKVILDKHPRSLFMRT